MNISVVRPLVEAFYEMQDVSIGMYSPIPIYSHRALATYTGFPHHVDSQSCSNT
jgi:hypothetical protein